MDRTAKLVILELLEMRNAMSAMAGKPCPVAVAVVARMKAQA